MLVTVDGIIVGIRSIGDSSCYLDILTDEFGVIEVIAHGVKKLNSKNAASTAMFSYSRFCLSKSHLKYTINSSAPKYSFYRVSEDIFTLSLASYFAEVIKFTSAPEQKQNSAETELRLLAVALYELIEKRIPLELIKAVFELKLCVLLGLMPDLIACSDCFCYEDESFYFLLESGIIICDDCFCDKYGLQNNLVFFLTPKLLHLMRYIIFTPIDKVFKIGSCTGISDELCIIAEKYLLYQTGKSFKSLDYYKKLSLF